MLSQEPAIQNYNVAIVSKLETFGLVDGPGVRFVIFLQGCNMRCKYCHNPETWATDSADCKKYTAPELLDLAWKYHNYWGSNLENGGITVSGGEPLLQIDFLIELFALAKKRGVNTCIDTSAQPFVYDAAYLEKFDRLIELTDLFIVDIKAFDSELHKSLTGHGNENIKQMLKYLSDKKADIWIRRVLVPGLTDSEKDLRDTSDFIKTLSTVKRVEVLPYHTLGIPKWEKLNIKYPLEGINSPTDEEISRAEKLLCVNDYQQRV